MSSIEDRDSVVLLAKATQSLVMASHAWQGSSFCRQFAVKQQPTLSDTQRAQRQLLLRMLAELIEPEFTAAMDQLVVSWLAYKRSLIPGGE